MRRALSPILLSLALAGAALGQTQQFRISTQALATGTVGNAYFQQLTVSGNKGVPIWSILQSNLPPGFAFDTSNLSTAGTLCTGTQNADHSATCTGLAPSNSQGSGWSMTVQAVDSQTEQVAQGTFNLTIIAANPPSINNQSLPVAVVGQAYQYQFTATGGAPPLQWIEFSSLSSFPGSFSLSSSGLLTSPQVTQADFSGRSGGLYTFAVQVLDANNRPSSPVQFNLTISQGLTITTATPLPSGSVGASYQGGSGLQLQATGGTGSYSWNIISGSLPSGLSMTSGGFIGGVPNSVVSQQQFTVQVTDVGVSTSSPPSTSKTFTISVVSSSLSITQTTLPFAFQNQPYTTTLTAQGGLAPFTWSLGANAVNGLTIGSTTGTLSGTPTNVPGAYSITVIVQDSAGGTYQFTFSLSIAANLSITTTTLPNGAPGTAYTATVNEAGGQAPYTWSLAAGSLPPGLTLQSSSGNSVTISGTPTASGVYQFTIKVVDVGSRTASAPLQIQIGPSVSISTTTLPDGSQGNTYNQNVIATGGQLPYVWSITSGTLPDGLTQTTSSDSTTLIISGTPSGQGTSTFTVQVKDAQGNTAQQSLTISIAVPIVITTNSVPNGTVAVAYSQPLGASGGTPPYNWTVINGTLPGGVTLNAANGLLSGTPTTAGNYSFTVQVKDSNGATAQRAFSMSVIARLTLTGGSFSGQVGAPFSQTLSATGGVPPYSFSISSGSLPPGVSFNGGNGSFTGTPSAAGNSSVVVVVTDSTGATANANVSFSITLNTPPPLTIAPIPGAPGAQPPLTVTIGTPFSVALTGTVVLTFGSSVGGDDQTVGFTNGSRTATFTIPAGQTTGVFQPAGLGVRTGTTAGTITLRLTQLIAAPSTDVTPNPAPQTQITIAPSAPVITAVSCTSATGGFTVLVTGYTTTRSMVSGTFTFTAPTGSTLQNNSVLVQLSTPFATWFGSAPSNATGGQFLLTMPFTIATGSSTGIGVSAALGNSVSGSNTLSATCP